MDPGTSNDTDQRQYHQPHYNDSRQLEQHLHIDRMHSSAPFTFSPASATFYHQSSSTELAFQNPQDATNYSDLCRRSDQNQYEIAMTRHIVQNDLQILQQQIRAVASKVDSNTPITTASVAPTALMLASHSKERLVQEYIRHANDYEVIAESLREQAQAMVSGNLECGTQLTLRRAPRQRATGRFMCCGEVSNQVESLVKHVTNTHSDFPGTHQVPTAYEMVRIPSPTATQFIFHPDDVFGVGSLKTPLPSAWQPQAIAALPPLSGTLPPHNDTVFSFDFLKSHFHGDEWSPGFYFVTTNKTKFPPVKAYWVVDADNEPFLPSGPGQHGAKITAFFNETVAVQNGRSPSCADYQNCPVFIQESGQAGYRYYGQYSQVRFSDEIGYDTLMEHVPESIRQHIAKELASPGRPKWVTQCLLEHFFPRPKYEGSILSDDEDVTPAQSEQDTSMCENAMDRKVRTALDNYAQVLKIWKKESEVKVGLLTADEIFKSFLSPDTDLVPGLRPYWEYLQCTGYDEKFYEMLINLREKPIDTCAKLNELVPGMLYVPGTPQPRNEKKNTLDRIVAVSSEKSKMTKVSNKVVSMRTLERTQKSSNDSTAKSEDLPINRPVGQPKQSSRKQSNSYIAYINSLAVEHRAEALDHPLNFLPLSPERPPFDELQVADRNAAHDRKMAALAKTEAARTSPVHDAASTQDWQTLGDLDAAKQFSKEATKALHKKKSLDKGAIFRSIQKTIASGGQMGKGEGVWNGRKPESIKKTEPATAAGAASPQAQGEQKPKAIPPHLRAKMK